MYEGEEVEDMIWKKGEDNEEWKTNNRRKSNWLIKEKMEESKNNRNIRRKNLQ
jgi:hypothetical protein